LTALTTAVRKYLQSCHAAVSNAQLAGCSF